MTEQTPAVADETPNPADEAAHRVTITVTPLTDTETQQVIDDIRKRFGRKPLIHVIGRQPSGTHVLDAPVPDAVVLDVATAIEDTFTVNETDTFEPEAVAAIAAARPHLTGPLEAEVARLRAALEAADTALNTAHRIADTHGSDLLGHDATELAELLDTASTATGAVLADPAPTTTTEERQA